jgi:hypothetical protein
MGPPLAAGNPSTSGPRRSADSDRWLEFAAKALALIVPLSPAVGLGVRWLAFSITPGLGPALPAAAGQSIAELTAAGGLFLLMGVAGTAAIFGVAYLARLDLYQRRKEGPHLSSRMRAVRFVGLACFVGAGLSFAYVMLLVDRGWAFGALGLLMLLGAVVVVRREARSTTPRLQESRSDWSWAFICTSVLAVLVTIAAALSGWVPGVGWATIDFKKFDSGVYVVLGRTGDTTYLGACKSQNLGTFVVPTTDIRAVSWSSVRFRGDGSLMDILHGVPGVGVGLNLNC